MRRVITTANSCVVTQKEVITASATRDTESALIGSRVKVKGNRVTHAQLLRSNTRCYAIKGLGRAILGNFVSFC